MSVRWFRPCPMGAANTSWAYSCVKHAKCSSASISLRKFDASVVTFHALPSLSVWSGRRCIASSRHSVSNKMSRIAYVNGRYLGRRDAMVHVEDRGYQFADGVYEVCEVRGGRIVDERRHMARLKRSLDELRIDMPMSQAALAVVLRECIRRNRVRDGILYLQITRGVARRDHGFPPPGTRPSIVVTAHGIDLAANERIAAEGVGVVTVPDNRWQRVDIKSISLLPNVLAKQAAREKGAKEAWFVDRDGHITEG